LYSYLISSQQHLTISAAKSFNSEPIKSFTDIDCARKTFDVYHLDVRTLWGHQAVTEAVEAIHGAENKT
jgi:hypothetical protein